MTSKPANDRLQAMRERAAALKKRPAEGPETTPSAAQPGAGDPPEGGAGLPLEAHFGISALDQVAAGRSVQRLALTMVAPEARLDQRQPRLLPPPAELLVAGQPAPAYADLVAALIDLGRSLQQRQIQPIIVYPGSSGEYLAARYLILVGHRRWTAAQLVGLATIDAIVVEPPGPVDRVQLQYAENEDRADFTDMERAWALAQMKQALGDASWESVEERFQMSRSRRMELVRLLSFSPAQQVQLARLRLRETQLRPLHQAVREADLSPERVDALFAHLEVLALKARPAEGLPAVDGPTIARLVARARREEALGAAAATAQWTQALLDQFGRTKRSIRSARRRLPSASAAEAELLRSAIEELAALLVAIEKELPTPEIFRDA
jgi:ParB/RepB/Spo0J family partition protein